MTNPVVFLEKLLTRAKDSYYGTGDFIRLTNGEQDRVTGLLKKALSASKMTDELFDLLEDKLREIAPNSLVLKQIGAPLKYSTNKVLMPWPLPSLDKIKPGTGKVENWASTNPGPWVESDKEDGVGAQITFKNNKPHRMYKANDNVLGIDITHLLPFLNTSVLHASNFRAIRVELVMKQSTFEENWSTQALGSLDGYENARNLVSGIVNKTNGIHPAAKDLHAVVLAVLDPLGVPSVQLAKLKAEGFNVVPHRVIRTLTSAGLSADLKKRKASSPYAIDGLVLVQNQINQLSEGNPDWGRAFKETTADDIVKATVVAVHWTLSKHKFCKPRVEIEPVRLAGVTVTFATGHNARYIVDNVIGPGAVVKISRSGDVIPYLHEVTKPATSKKPQLPTDYEWAWNKSNIDIVATGEHASVQIKQTANFFRTLGAVGIDEATIARCYRAGFTSKEDIMSMTVSQWLTLDNVKQTSATKNHESVKACLRNVYMPELADATGFFGRGFGTRRMEMVMHKYPDLQKLQKQTNLRETISNIKGFSEITAQQFVTGLPLFLDWLMAWGRRITFAKPETEPEPEGNKFANQIITFTNFRSPEWAEIVIKQGGRVDDFKAGTTMVVYPDNKPGSKTEKARSKGIQILTQTEFASLLKKYKL